jgi:protein-S-isoprenylcysteine O-methyltransferase Ste14
MAVIISSVIIMFAVTLYGVSHSMLASNVVKTYSKRLLGANGNRYYRLIYNFIAVISLLPVLTLVIILPDQTLYLAQTPWMYLLMAGQIVAVSGLLIGLWQTGINNFLGFSQLYGVPNRLKSDTMVVSGLYRCVRHPLYTAGLIFIWFMPVMTTNLFTLNLCLTLYIIVGIYFEERKLVRDFGDSYVSYRRSTPMLVPRPWSKTCRKPQTR